MRVDISTILSTLSSAIPHAAPRPPRMACKCINRCQSTSERVYCRTILFRRGRSSPPYMADFDRSGVKKKQSTHRVAQIGTHTHTHTSLQSGLSSGVSNESIHCRNIVSIVNKLETFSKLAIGHWLYLSTVDHRFRSTGKRLSRNGSIIYK